MEDRPRLFGVAVSHYQVEGGDPCDFTLWEKAGRTRGGPCGDAVGSWERYEEDGDLAQAVGANAFRFSVSWSRVERRPGVFDEAVLHRYRRFVDHLVARGLEPMVTLLHYTHPEWFHDAVSWTSPRSVEAFARFAKRTAEALGASVRLYVPLNEPFVAVLGGFLDGQIPPGLSNGKAASRAFDHMLAAHAAATAAIREVNPRAAVGVAHNIMAFAPERPYGLRFAGLDPLLARHAHRVYNRGLLEAFATGRWSLFVPPLTRLRGRREDLTSSLDFVGVNYYSRLHVRCPGKGWKAFDFAYRDPQGRGLTDNGWEIHPRALAGFLAEASAITGLPVVVTENGLADAADGRRTRFLIDHMAEVGKAERDGVPVAGYFHWSLLDNFEWLDGFEPRFGLFEVDRNTFERRARPSAETFRRLASRFLEDPPTAL